MQTGLDCLPAEVLYAIALRHAPALVALMATSRLLRAATLAARTARPSGQTRRQRLGLGEAFNKYLKL